MGSKALVENVKALLGFRGKGRGVLEGAEGYQVRERSAQYGALFGAEKVDMGPKNSYFWDMNTE